MFKRSAMAANEADVCALYTGGLTLRETATISKLCVSTVAKILRQHGVGRRNPSTRKVGRGAVRQFEDTHLINFKLAWDKLDSTVKGTIAETYVKNRLAELGFDVWEPFGQNHKTDLIVLVGTHVRRVQVKSATYDRKIKAFRANVTRHRRGRKITPYALENVDFFVVYCGGLETLRFYVVPAAKVIGRADIKLYPHRSKGLLPGAPDWESYANAFHLLGGP